MAAQNHRVRVQRTVGASRNKVYEALTQPKHLNKWFTSKAKCDLRVGGRYSNADHDTGEFTRLSPGRAVGFTWENPAACPGTTVAIRLYSAGRGKTRVVLGHSGLEKRERGLDGMYGGWSWALSSLKSYLETGRPLKHDDWMAQQKRKQKRTGKR